MQMKTGKTPGNDDITTEMLKHGHGTLVPVLMRLFNTCLTWQDTPKHMADSSTILLFKKGDPLQLKNYRPISLLSVIYKLLTKVINNQADHILDKSQPPEQASFRRNFSTINHLHSLNELIEKTHEYQLPLYMLFIDFEKAFDSVEVNAVWSAIQEQACLEQIFRRLPWDDRGINTNGRCLSNLRFADDIVLLANTADELQQMASELNDEAGQVGLKINASKTKAMSTTPLLNPIHLDDSEIEAVDNYIYLGQLITIVRDHTREIRRRKQAGWAILHQYRNFLTSHIVDMKYKRRLFNQCIIPAMLYGSECWALTKKRRDTMTAAQRRMERAMEGVNILDKKTNDWG
uniref:Reverse transcriptase domain-containing protein n=1 Tax=Plectus sambesii TaxID=2011161 RepID=A0A914VH66_9BILA